MYRHPIGTSPPKRAAAPPSSSTAKRCVVTARRLEVPSGLSVRGGQPIRLALLNSAVPDRCGMSALGPIRSCNDRPGWAQFGMAKLGRTQTGSFQGRIAQSRRAVQGLQRVRWRHPDPMRRYRCATSSWQSLALRPESLACEATGKSAIFVLSAGSGMGGPHWPTARAGACWEDILASEKASVEAAASDAAWASAWAWRASSRPVSAAVASVIVPTPLR